MYILISALIVPLFDSEVSVFLCFIVNLRDNLQNSFMYLIVRDLDFLRDSNRFLTLADVSSGKTIREIHKEIFSLGIAD